MQTEIFNQPDFYNTTKEYGKTLRLYNKKANQQNFIVLKFFKENPDKTFTPTEVFNEIATVNTPVSSFKRSITTLTKQGKLEKTTEKRMGEYGRMGFTWKLKPRSKFD